MNLLNKVKLNISGAVPERKKELEELWEKYSPQFEISHDKPGYNMDAGFGKLITFNQRTIYQIWLSGFSSWRAFVTYSPPIFLSIIASKPISKELLDHPKQHDSENLYSRSLKEIEEINKIDSLQNFTWPHDIPHPKNFDSNDIPQKAVFDLTVMAAAFAFLHEIRHIQIKQEGKNFDIYTEELNCDLYAINFMTNKIEEYSSETGYDYNSVLSKRATALAVISHLFLAKTSLKSWNGTDTHPPLNKRIGQIVDVINLPENDTYWLYMSSMLLAQFRINKVLPSSVSFNSYKDLSLIITKHITTVSC